MMAIDPIGLYVHIPFCKRKCNYCDFCSKSASDEEISLYTGNLIAEILSYRSDEIRIDSVFFGGGTPSVLSASDFAKIVRAIKQSFTLCDGLEFTVECNPATLDEEKLTVYKSCGVNRISLGVQSIHENELKKLGRIHSYDDFADTYRMIRAAGFNNVNFDLMYGIPEQTLMSFEDTLRKVIELSPEHISSYGLIIEEGTPFYEERDRLELPSEDEECDMYELSHKMLSEAGYSHYEISNYSKAGYECSHNLKYWRDEEYIGVGLAAHSYYLGKRFYNTENFIEYSDSFGIKYRKEESATVGIDPFEYAMLRLRLCEGLSLSEYLGIFKKPFAYGKEELIKYYVENGFMKIEDDRLSFTYKGFYVSNTILGELI